MVRCPICDMTLIEEENGNYRCEKCGVVYVKTEEGDYIQYERDDERKD